MRAFFPVLGLGALALFSTACKPIGPGTVGELGNGLFAYRCDSNSDPACDTTCDPINDVNCGTPEGNLQQMPKRVALSGRFSVFFTPTDAGSAIVETVSEELLTKTDAVNSSFKAVGPGVAGLLAKRGETIVDIIHLSVVPVDHIRVDASGEAVGDTLQGVSSVNLGVGQTATLRGVAVDEADVMLAGALSAGWSTDNEVVASIISSDTDNDITIQANGLGNALLRVTIEDQIADIAVTVGDGGTGGAGGGGTGGAGGAGGGP